MKKKWLVAIRGWMIFEFPTKKDAQGFIKEAKSIHGDKFEYALGCICEKPSKKRRGK